MKIEKLSDNQIRCTLTRADLAARQIRLSELAYGTDKAKSLFHDMIEQAAFEYGFEVENMPLMIEAVPASSDSIVLTITKVEDPEELDTRFSRFAPYQGNDNEQIPKNLPEKLEGAESIADILESVKEIIAAKEAQSKEANKQNGSDTGKTGKSSSKSNLRLFSFINLDGVLEAARLLAPMYDGANTLYKDGRYNIYFLALTQNPHTEDDFNRFCNMLSEYGSSEQSNGAVLAYLEEHCETIVPSNAIRYLAAV
ncbi:MAG: adaptor protein MecA [Lachnospiraceae bacterium]|jgi:adapter protein MecA 1/2|nr:adaptor protein MecA [Lachnospiraceae bacterium]